MSINVNGSQFVNFDQKNSWKFIIGGIILLIFLFWLAKGIFNILNIIAPFLLILTLVLNYRVVLGYGKWLLDLLKRDFLMGILACLGTVVFFPLVSGYLFAKVLLLRKVSSLKAPFAQINWESAEDGFTNYEEVIPQKTEKLELPQQSKPKIEHNYDSFFEKLDKNGI